MFNKIPLKYSARVLDVFLLDSEKVMFDILIRMMLICKERILNIDSKDILLQFFLNDMINMCFDKYAKEDNFQA